MFPEDKREIYLRNKKLEQEVAKRNHEPGIHTYLLSQLQDEASYANLIVKTGAYSEMTKNGLNLPDYRKNVFAEVFPETDERYGKHLGGVFQVSDHAPPGYEISDFSEYNALIAEIQSGLYRIEKC